MAVQVELEFRESGRVVAISRAETRLNDFIHLKISACDGERREERDIDPRGILEEEKQEIEILFIGSCPEN